MGRVTEVVDAFNATYSNCTMHLEEEKKDFLDIKKLREHIDSSPGNFVIVGVGVDKAQHAIVVYKVNDKNDTVCIADPAPGKTDPDSRNPKGWVTLHELTTNYRGKMIPYTVYLISAFKHQ